MTDTIAGYELLDRIGRGASGDVWRARKIDGGSLVAIKILREDLAEDSDALARFRAEGELLAGQRIVGVVPVHEAVVDGGRLAIVMDLIEGTDLRQLITTEGPLPFREAGAIAAQVADGLAAAHNAGIVHRDIKPENILVQRDASGTCAWVTDFGVARLMAGPSRTKTGLMVGTAAYVAPEVLTGGRATPAVDVYALGIVLFEMITGWRPFRGEHEAAVMQQHLNSQPMQPQGFPDVLWAIVASSLARDPEERPMAREIATKLAALGAGTLTAERLARSEPPPPTQIRMAQSNSPSRPVTTWRRPRTLVTLVAGSLLLASFGGFALVRAQQPDAVVDVGTRADTGSISSSATASAQTSDVTSSASFPVSTAAPSTAPSAPPPTVEAAPVPSPLPETTSEPTPPPAPDPTAEVDIPDQAQGDGPADAGGANPAEPEAEPAPKQEDQGGQAPAPAPAPAPTTQAAPKQTTAAPRALIDPPVGPTVGRGDCAGSKIGEHNHKNSSGTVVATTLIYYNSANGKNCALLRKGINVGVKSYLSLTLCNDKDECAIDRDYYTDYAGPVYVNGKDMCITFEIALLKPDRTDWVFKPPRSGRGYCR